MSVQTGCDYGDGSLVLSILVIHSTEDDVCIISCQLLNIACCLVCLDQADITGNIDNYMGSALDGGL